MCARSRQGKDFFQVCCPCSGSGLLQVSLFPNPSETYKDQVWRGRGGGDGFHPPIIRLRMLFLHSERFLANFRVDSVNGVRHRGRSGPIQRR